MNIVFNLINVLLDTRMMNEGDDDNDDDDDDDGGGDDNDNGGVDSGVINSV